MIVIRLRLKFWQLNSLEELRLNAFNSEFVEFSIVVCSLFDGLQRFNDSIAVCAWFFQRKVCFLSTLVAIFYIVRILRIEMHIEYAAQLDAQKWTLAPNSYSRTHTDFRWKQGSQAKSCALDLFCLAAETTKIGRQVVCVYVRDWFERRCVCVRRDVCMCFSIVKLFGFVGFHIFTIALLFEKFRWCLFTSSFTFLSLAHIARMRHSMHTLMYFHTFRQNIHFTHIDTIVYKCKGEGERVEHSHAYTHASVPLILTLSLLLLLLFLFCWDRSVGLRPHVGVCACVRVNTINMSIDVRLCAQVYLCLIENGKRTASYKNTHRNIDAYIHDTNAYTYTLTHTKQALWYDSLCYFNNEIFERDELFWQPQCKS